MGHYDDYREEEVYSRNAGSKIGAGSGMTTKVPPVPELVQLAHELEESRLRLVEITETLAKRLDGLLGSRPEKELTGSAVGSAGGLVGSLRNTSGLIKNDITLIEHQLERLSELL